MWLLQNRQLWLSRLDLLGDAWEGALDGQQLEHVIARHPLSPLSAPQRETAWERSGRISRLWRQTTFASCWSASKYESHALWRIYCGPNEGVAIQTTLSKLTKSAGDLPVHKIEYGIPGSISRTPTRLDLVTKKRPMFEYEHEVRLVQAIEGDAVAATLGHRLDWDPEKWIELIRVHPEADSSFMETVTGAVADYAPALKDRVQWSAMREGPPLVSGRSKPDAINPLLKLRH
jgi:hypothetical protein